MKTGEKTEYQPSMATQKLLYDAVLASAAWGSELDFQSHCTRLAKV